MIGKYPKNVRFWIKKPTSGGDGQVIMKHFDSSGTLKTTGSSVDINTGLSTSFAWVEFSFASPVLVANGDRITLEGQNATVSMDSIGFEFSASSVVANTNHVIFNSTWQSQTNRDTKIEIDVEE